MVKNRCAPWVWQQQPSLQISHFPTMTSARHDSNELHQTETRLCLGPGALSWAPNWQLLWNKPPVFCTLLISPLSCSSALVSSQSHVWIMSPRFPSAFLSHTELVPPLQWPYLPPDCLISDPHSSWTTQCNCLPTGFYFESLFSLNTSCCYLLRKIPFFYSRHQKLE